jgi:hypothetical protein
MRRIVALLALALLAGCAAKTDLRELGGAVGATWDKGPRVGVDASLGQHEGSIAPLFGAAGDAAEGAPGKPAPVEPAAVVGGRFSK